MENNEAVLRDGESGGQGRSDLGMGQEAVISTDTSSFLKNTYVRS